MLIELERIGATEQEVGGHEKLRNFQRPQRRHKERLGNRGVKQNGHHQKNHVHDDAADFAVHHV